MVRGTETTVPSNYPVHFLLFVFAAPSTTHSTDCQGSLILCYWWVVVVYYARVTYPGGNGGESDDMAWAPTPWSSVLMDLACSLCKSGVVSSSINLVTHQEEGKEKEMYIGTFTLYHTEPGKRSTSVMIAGFRTNPDNMVTTARFEGGGGKRKKKTVSAPPLNDYEVVKRNLEENHHGAFRCTMLSSQDGQGFAICMRDPEELDMGVLELWLQVSGRSIEGGGQLRPWHLPKESLP